MRVVCDTNTVVSALLFSRGRLAWLREAWRGGQIIPLGCRRTVTELLHVLAYPKFQLDAQEREALLGDYLPYVEVIEAHTQPTIPKCRDPKDQMFLELAISGAAQTLVTGDRDLLALSDRFAIAIETPAKFATRIASSRRCGDDA